MFSYTTLVVTTPSPTPSESLSCNTRSAPSHSAPSALCYTRYTETHFCSASGSNLEIFSRQRTKKAGTARTRPQTSEDLDADRMSQDGWGVIYQTRRSKVGLGNIWDSFYEFMLADCMHYCHVSDATLGKIRYLLP